MNARIIRGNALALPLADASVDLVVTSPPYFGLRSYQDAGEHYSGQIGAEPTPTEFVDALIAATRGMARVLKPSGSIWVNLGDKYQATSFAPEKRGKDASGVKRTTITANCERCGAEFTGGIGRRFCSSYCGGSDNSKRANRGGVPTKSLIGIPWRYAIRCIDDLGLILRAEVIWAKPNGLPESVTDRVRRSHETWLHFTKEPRYYSAVDEIREEHAAHPRVSGKGQGQRIGMASMSGQTLSDDQQQHPLGKLPGSVWTIPTQPLRVPPELGIDHFAAYPCEWPRRIIKGWSPAGVCTACGEGRRPVSVVSKREPNDRLSLATRSRTNTATGSHVGSTLGYPADTAERTITGYACACPDTSAPTTPGIVLDPFGGTGTTALVADVLGRTGISVDMSADYCRLATWRTQDPKQRERAARGPKPPKKVKTAEPQPIATVEEIHPDQLELFGEDVA